MVANLVLGTSIIAATVIIHTLGLIILSASMNRMIANFALHRHSFGKTVAMVSSVLGLFLIHTVEVWGWALVYLVIGVLDTFGDALYFSATTFSTLGYGDVTLDHRWRLLSALEGVSGFLLIGWSTAYLVGASTRYGPFRIGEHF